MTVIKMTSTVGALTSGQTYRLRAREAELLLKASQATANVLKTSVPLANKFVK